MVLRQNSWRSLACLALALLMLSGVGRAIADDHDAARAAVERGEIRPLTEVLNDVRGKLPGDIIGVELEQEDGRWLYEFHLIDSEGHLFKAYVDPRSGDIERVKEK